MFKMCCFTAVLERLCCCFQTQISKGEKFESLLEAIETGTEAAFEKDATVTSSEVVDTDDEMWGEFE